MERKKLSKKLNNGLDNHLAMEKNKIVIFSNPRSGSNYLIDVLAQSPDIVCQSEIFHPDDYQTFFDSTPLHDKFPTHLSRIEEPELYYQTINKLAFQNKQSAKISVIKVLNSPPQLSPLPNLLADKSIQWICLRRDNLLEYFTSFKIALATNVWIANDSDIKDKEQHKLNFCIDEFINFIETSKRNNYAFNIVNLSSNTLNLDYLDMFNNNFMDKICLFLKIKPWRFKANLTKQNKRNLFLCYENPEKLEKELHSKSLEHFLNENNWKPT